MSPGFLTTGHSGRGCKGTGEEELHIICGAFWPFREGSSAGSQADRLAGMAGAGSEAPAMCQGEAVGSWKGRQDRQ